MITCSIYHGPGAGGRKVNLQLVEDSPVLPGRLAGMEVWMEFLIYR